MTSHDLPFLRRHGSASTASLLAILGACAAPVGEAEDPRASFLAPEEVSTALSEAAPVAPWRWQAATEGCFDGALPTPLSPASGFRVRPTDGAPGLLAVVDQDGLVVCVDSVEAFAEGDVGIVPLADGWLGLGTVGWDGIDGLPTVDRGIGGEPGADGSGSAGDPEGAGGDDGAAGGDDGGEDTGEGDDGDEDDGDGDDEDSEDDEDGEGSNGGGPVSVDERFRWDDGDTPADNEEPQGGLKEIARGPWAPTGGDPNPQPMR